MDSFSDNFLMLKVRSGDTEKLGLLFERYNRILYNYFFRMTNCKTESEDLVQNVFVRMLKYSYTFEGKGKFSTWMYSIARNVYIDHYRKSKRNGIIDEFAQPDELPNGISNEEHSDRSEYQIALMKTAMDQLGDDKREILVLSRYQGLRYQEISEILDCSVSAVKVRAFRALNELKKIVSDLEKRHDYERR